MVVRETLVPCSGFSGLRWKYFRITPLGKYEDYYFCQTCDSFYSGKPVIEVFGKETFYFCRKCGYGLD